MAANVPGRAEQRLSRPLTSLSALLPALLLITIGSAGITFAALSGPGTRVRGAGSSDSAAGASSETVPTPSASGTDFRFLPALAQASPSPTPEATPAPTPAATPTPLTGSLDLRLTGGDLIDPTRAAVRIGWTGPGGKPVSAPSLTSAVDGAAAQPVRVARGTTSVIRTARAGHRYAYTMQAAGSGGAAAINAAAGFAIRSIDNDDRAVAYAGSWATAQFPGYAGGTAAFSRRSGSAATLTFSGSSVAWIGPVGPGRGAARVDVDGRAATTVSTAAQTFAARRVLFVRSWPKAGRHTLRITLVGGGGETVAIDSFTVLEGFDVPVAPAPTPQPTPAPTAAASSAPLPDAKLPIRGAFFYGWYPEAWAQAGQQAWTNYHPSDGSYDSSDPVILGKQILAMRYGGIDTGIASWWGIGTRTDGRMSQLLSAAHGTGVTWAIDVDVESIANLDADQASQAIGYISDHYAKDPAYLRTGGRFVLFVRAGPDDTCDVADRWVGANAGRAYLVLGTVSGYAACARQPDDWFASDPTVSDQQVGSSSYVISPGFWRPGEGSLLPRDATRWADSVRAMISSGARFQLIASFNQWRDGSSIESAREWASPSGFGSYVDALHVDGATAQPSQPATPGGGDPVLVGAGAIASCDSTGDEDTASLVNEIDGTVFTVGDNALDSGSGTEFQDCYGPSWGAFRERTRPAVGSRDYVTPGAAGYFGYFGTNAGPADKGYYAYDLDGWRIYVLNSNCAKVGGCQVGSPQERWLKSDLAAHPSQCVGAYWQSPRFSTGRFGDDTRVAPFWNDLFRAGAEFVIAGHDRNYQRLAPLTPQGKVGRTTGIREFIVGTGGSGHTLLAPDPADRREAGTDQSYGVLRLTLHPTGYEWQFVATPAVPFVDQGAASCH